MTPRFQALDGLRGVAALMVVLSHVEWSTHLTGLRIVTNGYLAVDLFFILSGLVIAANYSTRLGSLRECRDFILLRFFRLYPLHLALLGAFVGLECLKLLANHGAGVSFERIPFTGGQSVKSLVTHLALLQGFGLLPTPGWNGPSWSISTEFGAYLVFAGATIAGLSGRRLAMLIGVGAAAAAYVFLGFTRGTLDVVLDMGFVRCLAGFTLGLILHHWSLGARALTSASLARWQVAATVAVVVMLATTAGSWIVMIIPLFVVLIAMLRNDRGPIARLLVSRPAAFLGQISYSVYMVHELIVLCIRMALRLVAPTAYEPSVRREIVMINPWVGDVLVVALLALILAVATLTYTWIEEPWRMYGRRLVSRRHAPASFEHRTSLNVDTAVS